MANNTANNNNVIAEHAFRLRYYAIITPRFAYATPLMICRRAADAARFCFHYALLLMMSLLLFR